MIIKKKANIFFKGLRFMILKAYQGISWTTYPLVKFILSKRRKKGKEDAIRYRERMGIYTRISRALFRPLYIRRSYWEL